MSVGVRCRRQCEVVSEKKQDMVRMRRMLFYVLVRSRQDTTRKSIEVGWRKNGGKRRRWISYEDDYEASAQPPVETEFPTPMPTSDG